METRISMQALKEKTDNIYKLVRVASMRAKELNLGGRTLLDKPSSKNYATIALQEIIEDKICIVEKEEAEKQLSPALNIFKNIDKNKGPEEPKE